MVYRLNEIPHNGLKKRVSIDLRNIDIGLPKTVNGNVHGSKKLVCTFDEAAELTGKRKTLLICNIASECLMFNCIIRYWHLSHRAVAE